LEFLYADVLTDTAKRIGPLSHDVNLLTNNTNTTTKNRGSSIRYKGNWSRSKPENNKYILISRYQNKGQGHNVKIGSISFENGLSPAEARKLSLLHNVHKAPGAAACYLLGTGAISLGS
jgi:hypothetical protein